MVGGSSLEVFLSKSFVASFGFLHYGSRAQGSSNTVERMVRMEKKKVQALAQFFAIAFPAATTEFMIAIV